MTSHPLATNEPTPTGRRRGRLLAVAALLYGALLLVLLPALFSARNRVIAQLDNEQARADWQAWKARVVAENAQGGPVQRRVPKGDEPPILVLMRDHFGVVLTAATVLISCLYLFLVLVVRGAFFSASRPVGEPRD